MPLVKLTKEQALSIGLEAAGFDEIRQKCCIEQKLIRFNAHFGAGPTSCSLIFQDIQKEDCAGEKRINQPDIFYFFMSMMWLKAYPSEPVLAGKFQVSERSVRKWCWRFLEAIQALKSKKVMLQRAFIYFISNFLTLLLLYFKLEDSLGL